MGDTYAHGHHASVLRSHEWRSAENSAGYLLPHLRPGQRLLDVGCGPGNITLDLARRVAPGPTFGFDYAAEVIDRARANTADALADPDGPDLTFATADVYALDRPDGSFDVAHAHQVLQHLTDPVAALTEIRRVLVPGGLLGVRDADYGAFTWSPANAGMTRWNELYHQIARHNGAEPDAGRHLQAWVRAAGFTDIRVSTATWTFADPDGRAFWANMWADRVEQSAFAVQALEYDLSTEAELAEVAAAWRAWAHEPDGFYVVLHTEVLATA